MGHLQLMHQPPPPVVVLHRYSNPSSNRRRNGWRQHLLEEDVGPSPSSRTSMTSLTSLLSFFPDQAGSPRSSKPGTSSGPSSPGARRAGSLLTKRGAHFDLSKDVVAVVVSLTSLYRAPAFIHSHNGPELIAQALRDWCEASTTTNMVHIEPGCPWENGFAESLNGR